ncbi:cyclophilin-like fold protein [Haloplanus halophilus]|uniref:cyclophilin-like fold protein n=1 Tax=Haloplanus halophilus TaxID=2949993 RepID=UPI00203D1DBE|nr:cyclophilin-like fold protein [Haloplanus sp. GDY1]
MSDGRFTVVVDGTDIGATWAEESPETRRALVDALPVEGEATRWGDELYFRVPVDVEAEDPRAAVDPGTVAYWPQGSALCLFWGPTPASTDSTPRAASPVNVVGHLDDVSALSSLPSGAGATVRVVDD